MNEEIKYMLIYEYHDDNYEIYDSLGLLKLALNNLKESFKNDRDFKYKIYCVKDITNLVEKVDDNNVKSTRI